MIHPEDVIPAASSSDPTKGDGYDISDVEKRDLDA